MSVRLTHPRASIAPLRAFDGLVSVRGSRVGVRSDASSLLGRRSSPRASSLRALAPAPRRRRPLGIAPASLERRAPPSLSAANEDVSSGYGGDGPSISDVQAMLDAAVLREDFAEAASLRDRLAAMRDDASASALEANEAFYRAFRAGDATAMRDAWGVGSHVQCIHPGAACISGSDQVAQSWDVVFGSLPPGGGGLDVKVEQVRVHAGNGWGVVTCVERVDSDTGTGTLAATNVFEVQGGEWKIIHHHAHGVQSLR